MCARPSRVSPRLRTARARAVLPAGRHTPRHAVQGPAPLAAPGGARRIRRAAAPSGDPSPSPSPSPNPNSNPKPKPDHDSNPNPNPNPTPGQVRLHFDGFQPWNAGVYLALTPESGRALLDALTPLDGLPANARVSEARSLHLAL